MLLALSFSSFAWGQARSDLPVTSPPLDRIVPLEVTVNGQQSGTWPFVERQGQLFASREALDEWRVRITPGANPVVARGVEYWPLAAIPGFTAKPNYSNQAVELTFSPDAFTSTQVTSGPLERPRLTPVLPSAFLNYELNYTRSTVNGGGRSDDVGALVEVGASNAWGLLTSSYVGRQVSAPGTSQSQGTRLETTFTRNSPEHQTTLKLGDATTRIGAWGRNVYFGGVQYGTNYALTPGFLTQPIPVVRGVSAAPSTVELYVNDVLRQVTQVPTGPFAIDNTAAITGGGEARLVVRDILGREVVITEPFFTSSSLLAKGLSDWSVEAGALRRDLGLASANYGPGFTSGTWRHGYTNGFTGEVRYELTSSTKVVGGSMVAVLPAESLGRLSLVGSNDARAGSGRQWLLGFERQWLKTLLQGQVQAASSGFRSLGQPELAQNYKTQAGLNVTHTTSSYGNFGAAAVRILPWVGTPVSTVSVNHSVRVFGFNTLTTSISRAWGAGAGTSVGFSLQIPLEHNRQVTVVSQHRSGATDTYATASRTATEDDQLGWRVLAGQLANLEHAEAGLYYSGSHGNVYGEASASRGQSALRAGTTGALVLAEGNLFSTRRIEQSYALVEVKDFENIGVGIGSNVLTATDAKGVALLPNLTPFVANQIRLNPQDLPVSAEIDSIEDVVVPPLRAAVKLTFPVRSGRAALLRITLDDGEPVPPGAIVRVDGDAREFWVARRGEAYVSGMTPQSRIALEWKSQRCPLHVLLPPLRDDIPRVPVRCEGVKR